MLAFAWVNVYAIAMGRPKVADEVRRTELVPVRLTASQLEALDVWRSVTAREAGIEALSRSAAISIALEIAMQSGPPQSLQLLQVKAAVKPEHYALANTMAQISQATKPKRIHKPRQPGGSLRCLNDLGAL